MTDPLIGAVAQAAGAGTDGGPSVDDMVGRAFGQAAGEVSAALGRYTPRQVANIAAVTVAASAKFGRSPDAQTSMRAVMRIAEEAAFAENEAITEYLSGVLASARSTDGSDDRAVGWSALVARLSSDQLRMHFLLYAALRQHLLGRHEDTTDTICAESCFVSYAALYKAMEWPRGEGPRFHDALFGLSSEDLVGAQWAYGPAESLESRFTLRFPDGGVVFQASRTGLGLWLWGAGYGARRVTDALDPELEMRPAVLHVSLDTQQTKLLSGLHPAAPA